MVTDCSFIHILISPIRSTCPTNQTFLDLLMFMVTVGEYKFAKFLTIVGPVLEVRNSPFCQQEKVLTNLK